MISANEWMARAKDAVNAHDSDALSQLLRNPPKGWPTPILIAEAVEALDAAQDRGDAKAVERAQVIVLAVQEAMMLSLEKRPKEVLADLGLL